MPMDVSSRHGPCGKGPPSRSPPPLFLPCSLWPGRRQHSGVTGPMGESRVELLRDFRKSLIDRLPVAVQLYQDESVTFPARRQFLLDWLLDSFYRLLKWNSPE